MMKKTTFLFVLLALLGVSKYSEAQKTIVGSLIYHNKYKSPITQANVQLIDKSGTIIDETTVNDQGYYTFYNVENGDYSVHFSSDLVLKNFDMQDTYLLQRYLLGLCTLDEVQLIAADVNKDNSVDWKDYNFMLKNYYLQLMPFPAGKWGFLETQFSLTGVTNKGSVVDTIDPSTQGTSMGDLNGFWIPDDKKECYIQSTPGQNITALPGQEFTIPVYPGSDLTATGMALVLNINAQNTTVLDVESEFKNLHYSQNNGQLRITWMSETLDNHQINNNTPLIYIKLKTNTIFANETQMFTLSNETQFINKNGNIVEHSTLSIPTVTHKNIAFYSYPNPCYGNSHIIIKLQQEEQVEVTLWDNSGRKLKTLHNQSMEKGSHTLDFNTNRLTNGIYFYRVKGSVSGNIQQSKMMVISN